LDTNNPLSTSLAGLFVMNEGSGSTDKNLVDSQTASFSGGSVPTWISSDPSISFNGGSSLHSYLNAGTDLTFDKLPVSQTTIVAEVYISSLQAAGICEKNDDNAIDSGFTFGWDGNGALYLTVEKSTLNMHATSANGAVAAGRWIQVAFTWDGTIGTAATAHLFVNGLEQAKTTSSDGSGTLGYANATNQPFRIGNVSFGQVAGSLNGKMAYLAVYKGRILTTTELAALNTQLPIQFTGISPVITNVSTSVTATTSQVIITGANFGSTQSTSSVTFNGTPATISSWSGTSIVAVPPTGITGNTASAVVTVAGVSSNSVSFMRPLPYPWLDQDVGTVGIAGNGGYAADVFTVNSSGTSASGTTDSLNLTYQPLSGDGTIIARIASLSTSAAGAGVVFRETLNAGATNFNVVLYPYYGSPYIQERTSTGGSTSSQQYTGPGGSPYWLKLTRSGNSFTAYVSSDGMNWTEAGSTQTITMAQNAYVGVFATSNSSTTLASVTFDNVSVSTPSAPAPVITGVSDTTGSIGGQIVISGSSFGSSQGASVATLNGMPVTINNWSNTSITFTIPTGATSGWLKVSVAPFMTDSNYVEFTVESSPLPNPWLDQDIGSTSPVGSASYSSGTFTLSAGGAGAWNSADAIHFVYLPLSGDGTIIARLTAAQNGGGTPSAGVMIRESLSPGAVNAQDYYSRYTFSANISERYTTGGTTSGQQLSGSVSLPYWFQLVRSGSTFTSYGSSDGAHWVQIGSTQTITMATNTYAGLTLAAGNGALGTATFDNVSVTQVSGPQTPVMTSLTPNAGLVGSSVTIAGSNFGPTQGSSTITFSGVTATVSSWTTTALTVSVPNGAITGDVVVTVGGLSTPGVNFTVLLMPTISSLSPTYGGAGTSVTITGTNYGATQGSSVVSFNGTNASSITSWSNTQIVALVPSGATTGAVSVTVSTITSTSNPTFTIYDPVITSITPPAASPGGTITINGTGFNGNAYNVPVYINGQMNQVGQWTNTTVTMGVPSNATSGSLYLTVAGVASNSVQFTVLEPLAITAISPTIASAGTSITITGAGFGATQSNSTLNFYGGTATSITSWSDTQIVALIPAGASSGAVNVVVAGQTVYGPVFTQTATTQTTDSLGNSSSYTVTLVGGQWLLTSATGTGCSSCTVRGVVQDTYDSNGNVLTTTDELGHTVTRAYDSNNNLLSSSQPLNSNTTATSSYTYNSFGEVLTATDPLGNVTTNTYDSHGNLLTVTSPVPAGGVAASVTQFAYNSLGELTSITDALGHVSTLTYTTAGLVATITDAQSNVTTYGYDSHGNRTSVTDPAGNVTSFAYDAGDRLTMITYPPVQSGQSSTTSTFTYDSRGRRTSATDQNGKTTTYAFDTADRLTSMTDAASNVTAYAYDTENNLLSITDANSHTTTFSYDVFGRVVQTTFPSNLSEFYAYDSISNLVSKTDRNANTIQYVYDALNRLTQKSYPDSSTAAYVYDLAGKVTHVNDPSGTYGFNYDNMGRLTGTTAQYSFMAGTTFTDAYTYDAASNRSGYTAPNGSTNTYTYDTLNRLTTLVNSWAGSFGFTYDSLSRRTQMTRPNGVNTNYAYDSLSQLLSVLHQAGGSTIDGASYNVDATGNRTSKTDQLAGVTSNFSYDSIYELTQVTQAANQTESYTYDPVGNRLSSLTAATSTYNASNELTSNSNATYTYDNNGNTLTKTNGTGTTNYTWDFENRLTSVVLPGTGGTVTFKYDPFGRRIQKSLTTGATPPITTTTTFAYDGDNITETTDNAGNILTVYVEGSRTDEPLAAQQAGIANYYEADGLGSITALTNSVGAPTVTYAYDSFGNLTASAGSSAANSFRYTAREFDTETALYYYRNRYYDPSEGRFMSEDPVSFFSGAVDFYSYVENSPTGRTDPNGLQSQGPTPCCPQDQQKIKDALGQLRQAFNGTKAAQSFIFNKYKTCLLNHLNNPDIKCGPTPKNQPNSCAYQNPMSPGNVVLTPPVFAGSGRCEPLRMVIAHELVHVCFQDDLTGPALNNIDQEKEAFGLECQIWGVRCTCARDPKKCGY
jgi:RHS repeat-associated protein